MYFIIHIKNISTIIYLIFPILFIILYFNLPYLSYDVGFGVWAELHRSIQSVWHAIIFNILQSILSNIKLDPNNSQRGFILNIKFLHETESKYIGLINYLTER